MIQLYGKYITDLEYGIKLFQGITMDSFGRFVNDTKLQDFIDNYKVDGPKGIYIS